MKIKVTILVALAILISAASSAPAQMTIAVDEAGHPLK